MKNIRRNRGLLLVATLIILMVSCGEKEKKEVKKPNIVLILSDDQAWNDYGFMGHGIVETPHLDRLASQSVVFKRGYVPSPICRPSLMTLATGLYPHQHKITGNDPKGGYRESAYPREALLENIDKNPSLPQILAEQGYLSHQSGKWWEGNYKRGGFTHGMTEGSRHGDKGLTIGREGMDSIFNFIDHAVSKDKPFYVWYAPFLPHSPHNPPDSLFQKYANKTESDHIARYYAMVEWFDSTCGQLLNYLDDNDLRENTLIYYVCDNGWIQKADSNKVDLGSKQTPMDGGVRTPIMFSLPGKLKPALRPELVQSIDLFPTVLSAANIELPLNLPGLDLWDELTEEKPIDRNIIFGEAYGHDIIDKDNPEASLAYLWCIEGDWKLILSYDGIVEGGNGGYDYIHDQMRKEPIRLYKIVEDPYEKNNLADEHPEKVEQLKQKIEAWYPLKERKVLNTKHVQ
ncbi:MAG: sulfatase [Maribacter sp.]|nr:sulfatase [Maribacter sp.]